MAHLLIWGETREILGGGPPATVPAEEVRSLAALEAALDGRGAALVLADPQKLEAEREAIEAWLRAGGSAQVVLVVVVDPEDGDEVLRRLPFVDDLLLRPVTPVRLQRKLERAIEAVHSRRVIRQLESAVSRKGDELSELNKIGVALSAQRDINQLLNLILLKSREITGADAGSLYLVERTKERGNGNGDRLRFKLAQNDTVVVPFEESTMPLDDTSIAGYVALTRRRVTVPDAYRLPEGSPYHVSRSFDEASGYRTKSMLVVPMCDHDNQVIGAIQLINKKRDRRAVLQPVSLVEEEVIPFTTVDEELVGSLASQAAVAFENAKLIQDIKDLFESFVKAAVTAIEQRDPTTSGHSERVALLTVGLAERVDAVSAGPLAGFCFSRDQLRELRYAGLLHDFGKVGVREDVLVKGKKLYDDQLNEIRRRFEYVGKSLEAEHLRRKLDAVRSGHLTEEDLKALDAEYEERRRDAGRILQAVLEANEPTVVEEENFRALMGLPTRPLDASEGEQQLSLEEWARGPYLSASEIATLSIRKGSLLPEERLEIESHVQHTFDFLEKIPWTGEFERIPEIAYAHHEKLDGSGYPRKLTAPDIPVQSRIMTISDIFDALVAIDRPYKRAQPVERALDILTDEAKDGKLDADLLRVFLEAKIFEMPDFKARLKPRA
jgi:HD-GYP domain-containing protein (c-di-GMP phosphodiesterase class II)